MRRLILRPGAIGDCILSFPALEHLAVEYAEIWVPSPLMPLIKFASVVRSLASTGIDKAGVGGLGLSAKLAEHIGSFDSIVSWYGANRPEFRATLVSTGVSCTFLTALPPVDYSGHATEFFAEQVGADKSATARIAVAQASCRGTVVIHPFSGGKRKNWPLRCYEQVAERLKPRVEWIAGPEEDLERAKRFDDLAYLASWLRGARLYIGNDSGITHLAAAVGVPTLALFGPTDPKVWGPRGENVTVLHSHTIDNLAVETVLEAANRLLDS
ncbi:MAG: glycosyltransferase family 9 protein [Acidobacteriota bacterium]|nr:glycosyltransferase family 9 protein [Acidobacteriota bacterium]